MATMERPVHIEGEGVAAACCAQLFSDRGQPFSLNRAVRPKPGAVLLSRQTVFLIAEIFPAIDLISACHPIEKRIVVWGAAEPITLPHVAFVIAEADLLAHLWQQVSVSDPSAEETAGWKLLSRAASCPQQKVFGTRIASVTRAVIKPHADPGACWIESVASGWLFLLPRGDEAATLISVGDRPNALLSQSRLIANVIDVVHGPATEIPAYPRIAAPLGGDGWLACGGAAMAFDPLCGEGTGNAVRQAYLATALFASLRAGEPAEDLLAHYTSRQMHGLLRHLQLCLRFYQSGGATAFWRSEAAMLEQGIDWAGRVLQRDRPAAYRLVGRQLEPI
jgi:hypothetical protein